MLTYVDTSAWGKLLLAEPESEALKDYVDARVASDHRFVSSALLEIELCRIAHREGEPPKTAQRLLRDIVLLEISGSVIATARAATRALKSLDAIHLASALLLAEEDEAEGDDDWIDVFVTYDAQLAAAARDAGFEVASPGAEAARG